MPGLLLFSCCPFLAALRPGSAWSYTAGFWKGMPSWSMPFTAHPLELYFLCCHVLHTPLVVSLYMTARHRMYLVQQSEYLPSSVWLCLPGLELHAVKQRSPVHLPTKHNVCQGAGWSSRCGMASPALYHLQAPTSGEGPVQLSMTGNLGLQTTGFSSYSGSSP
jgi:hypothetical protein